MEAAAPVAGQETKDLKRTEVHQLKRSKMQEAMHSLVDSHIKETALQSDHDGVRAIARVQLGENTLQMILDCVLRDVQIGSDDLVGITICHATKNIEFTSRDRIIRRVFGDLLGDIRRNAFIATVHHTNGFFST